MGKVITVFNQKGGVGKTTTNVNLSACLALLGKKVLVLDNDPQGNTTSGLGVEKGGERNIYEALLGIRSPEDSVVATSIDGLDIIPSDMQLAGAEIEMIELESREQRLKEIVSVLKSNYDYILVDCPPSLGMLTINALVAADSVLIPIQCEYYALEGVSQLMSTYQLVKQSINTELEIQGVLLTMYDGRTNLSIQVQDEVKKYFGDAVYDSVIPRSVRLAEAPSFGMPIITYDPRSKGAIAYMALAHEFLKWEEKA